MCRKGLDCPSSGVQFTLQSVLAALQQFVVLGVLLDHVRDLVFDRLRRKAFAPLAPGLQVEGPQALAVIRQQHGARALAGDPR
jgi:hypothetical protein